MSFERVNIQPKSINRNTLRGVVYARYSTEMQSDGYSIDGQVAETKKYAYLNNINIVGIYVDEAQSGQKKDRIEFNNILTDAKDNQFDAVIVHALSRASRFQNITDYYGYKSELEKYGVALHSTTEDITNSEIGEVIEFFTVCQAKNEIVKIRSNVMRSMKYKASNAEFNGGYAPLGYKIIDKKYIINEDESEIIRHVFSAYLDGKGYLAIANELNAIGYTTRFGKDFGKNSVHSIINNIKYIGVYEYNRTPSRDKNGSRNSHSSKSSEDVIRIDDAIPAIIDKKTWYEVQEIMSHRKRDRQLPNSPYLLSGLITCGNCGASFGGKYMKTRDKYYYGCFAKDNGSAKCTSLYVPRDVIENALIDYLKDIAKPANLKTVLAYFENASKTMEFTTTSTKRDLVARNKELKKESNKIMDMMLEINSPSLQSRLRAVDAKISELVSLIADQEVLRVMAMNTTAADIVAPFEGMKNIDSLERADKKAILMRFIRGIIVTTAANGEKDIEITTYLDKYVNKSINSKKGTTNESCTLLNGAEDGT